jgi:hypothetical protein
MTAPAARYVGTPDFHDGFVRAVNRNGDTLTVNVEGDIGIEYVVNFSGVLEVDSLSPVGMMLYALAEWDTDREGVYKYEFINWYFDEPETVESNAHLRILATGVTVDRCNA